MVGEVRSHTVRSGAAFVQQKYMTGRVYRYSSHATVKTHVGSILARLGLRDRVTAVIFAYDSGLAHRAGAIGNAKGPAPAVRVSPCPRLRTHLPSKTMAAIDYYALLGVEPEAETTAIRLAYRALARVHHPDHSGGTNAAMASLNEAWAVLGDVSARATYDGDHGFSTICPEPGTSATPTQPAPAPSVKSSPDILDFGRYAGWSLRDLVSQDPDYLLWLERTPAGRRYRGAINALLRQAPTPLARASRSGSSRGR